MSNYQARQRATRAERAALRCEQLVDEMREQIRRRERQIWEDAHDRFLHQTAALQAKNDHLVSQIVAMKELDLGPYLVTAPPMNGYRGE